MKKRVIAMLLAGVMALSLTACGGGDSDKGKKESGKEMKVAMVTDSGDLKKLKKFAKVSELVLKNQELHEK